MADQEFYLQPIHGWTCFHCGETFRTVGGARDHFGADQSADPACRIKVGDERGLVMALRRAEAELARYRAEDSDKDREFHAMRAGHAQALLREEERGYERGLRDGLEEAARIAEQQDRTGREWVRDSLWANIIGRVPAAIRRAIAK
jgi:flagellar biosynthesis/type III secretory pathway protein FliH